MLRTGENIFEDGELLFVIGAERESKAIQEYFIKYEFGWFSGRQMDVKHTEKPFLFVEPHNKNPENGGDFSYASFENSAWVTENESRFNVCKAEIMVDLFDNLKITGYTIIKPIKKE